jgi:hypothetical protein
MSLWDKVRSGASRATEEVTSRATEAANRATEAAQKQATTARLGMQIDDTKSEIRRKTADMGRLALDLVRQGDVMHGALLRASQEIGTLEAQVKDYEEQIAKVRSGSSAAEPEAGAPAGSPAGSPAPE